jgi:hypothetical protein
VDKVQREIELEELRAAKRLEQEVHLEQLRANASMAAIQAQVRVA